MAALTRETYKCIAALKLGGLESGRCRLCTTDRFSSAQQGTSSNEQQRAAFLIGCIHHELAIHTARLSAVSQELRLNFCFGNRGRSSVTHVPTTMNILFASALKRPSTFGIPNLGQKLTPTKPLERFWKDLSARSPAIAITIATHHKPRFPTCF